MYAVHVLYALQCKTHSFEGNANTYHDKSYEKYNFVHVYLRGILHFL